MAKSNLLSVLDIVQALDMGKATTKFLLKRFQNWIPSTFIEGQPFYPNNTINLLFAIQGKLEMGVLPGDIEKQLDGNCLLNEKKGSTDLNSLNTLLNTENIQDDIRLSKDGLQVLKKVFSEIGEQQKRIAKAHEQRAEAEQRKAVAIEKRAEAEEKKAEAMNNIANALQEMNRLRASDPASQQIVYHAASALTADENDPEPALDDDTLDTDFNQTDLDLSSLFEEPALNESFPEDDFSEDELLSEDQFFPDDGLFSEDDLLSDNEPLSDMDDLSLLLEPETQDQIIAPLPQTDDLYLLLDETDLQNPQLDDLSKLLDTPSLDERSDVKLPNIKQPDIKLDDLSALIDPMPEPAAAITSDMDDLSLLIQDTPSQSGPMGMSSAPLDDLSKLIDPAPSQIESSSPSASVADTPIDSNAIKIDITPQEDMGKYKAAVMQVIIGLKTEGLSIEETTNRLNANKIKTLSGKPEWGQKAISQIYTFIDAAK